MRTALLLAALFLPRVAFGEADEISGGLEAALVLPGFSSENPTAFALATWGVGAMVQYGVLDDLYVQGRFSFMTFRGRSERTMEVFGSELSGTLQFETLQYQAEIGGRYKLISGYDLAPYVESQIGFLWSGYQDQRFLTPNGRDYGLDLSDFGEGALTLAAGAALDYRLFNLVFVGVAARFVFAVGERLHRYYLSVPLQVSVFW